MDGDLNVLTKDETRSFKLNIRVVKHMAKVTDQINAQIQADMLRNLKKKPTA